MTFAVYNEIEPFAAKWLRALIEAGELSNGIVNETDVRTLDPKTLREATRVHLFAGIGGWDRALRLAGWPDDRPVWTGSCPCQPFSSAGRAGGLLDERHLWPAFRGLVAECRPPVIFGEQVASADGRAWLAGIRADLERMGYAFGAADLPAACVGAPHIRQRLFWVAESGCNVCQQGGGYGGWMEATQRSESSIYAEQDRCVVGLADASSATGERRAGRFPAPQAGVDCPRKLDRRVSQRFADGGEADRLADAQHERARPGATGIEGREGERRSGLADGGGLGNSAGTRRQGHRPELPARRDQQLAAESGAGDERLVQSNSEECRMDDKQGRDEVRSTRESCPWNSFALVHCRDGKARRIEPGSFPLAHGIPGRVGRLRGYGNAIVPQVAALFIQAYLTSRGTTSPD